ncbi:Hypothetical predicted protein [Cloeon dipterum]|uniref:GH18 domain-containing protein n=1 Tax=Cloeon dipterum TaxID=197152 RepID=A0A8S1CMP9_9INSE|nr:Hypothetical predicted protein [Cloeon dipterum]
MEALITFLLLVSTLTAAQAYSDLKGHGQVGSHKREVVCYVSSWAAYRRAPGNFSLTDLDPTICTHLVYAFAGLNSTSSEIRSLDPYRDLEDNYGLGWYRKLTVMKKQYPHLKVTIAIGGWNEGSTNYSRMAEDPQKRQIFIQSVIKFLDKFDFDGLDLDWEFPANRGGKPEDKENFVTLVKELRAAMPNKLLTAAFGAGETIIKSAYNIRALSTHLDLMHIMAYDYHGTWEGKTGSNAPLRTVDSHDPLSISYTIKLLKSLGAPARKIVLGVPMYGRTFLLKKPAVGEDQQVQPFGEATQERGFQGPYTGEDGFMGYNEICKEVESPSTTWRLMWDETSKTPYAVSGDKWISYDNERSVAEKAKFAIEEDLGGVMVWSIDTDDFRGDCRSNGETGGHFPLVTALNVAMAQVINERSTEVIMTSTTEQTSGSSTLVTSIAVCAISFVMMLRNL